MILGTIIPNNYLMPFEAVSCWLSLAKKYPFYSWSGPSCTHNRNEVYLYAKKQNDDLLFIDSDMIFTSEDVEKMEKHLETYDIVTGVYLLDFGGYTPALFERVEGNYRPTNPPQFFAEVGASGAGFLGISKRVYEKLDNEPFRHQWEGKIQYGEDVSFCHLARQSGFKVWCDPTIKLGHIKNKIIYPDRIVRNW